MRHSDRGSRYAAPRRTARGSRGMGSVARWAGAATPATTPRRGAPCADPRARGGAPERLRGLPGCRRPALPRFIDEVYNARRPHAALGHPSPVRFEAINAREAARSRPLPRPTSGGRPTRRAVLLRPRPHRGCRTRGRQSSRNGRVQRPNLPKTKKMPHRRTGAAELGRKRLKSGVTGKHPMNTPVICTTLRPIAREN